MNALFTSDNLIALFTLASLEIILGIDNVIFVSIITDRLPKEKQNKARLGWMIGGIAIRACMLFGLGFLMAQKGKPVFTIMDKGFDLSSITMLLGGLFLLYSTVKEIHHKLEGDEKALENDHKVKKQASLTKAIINILAVDFIFSLDSMVTAVGIGKDLTVMIAAVSIAMVVMFFFAGKISAFIHKRPTLKMLALAFLVMVGGTLLMEGWNPEVSHELHIKNYVYACMAFSFGVEVLNMRSSRKKKPVVELNEPQLTPDYIRTAYVVHRFNMPLALRKKPIQEITINDMDLSDEILAHEIIVFVDQQGAHGAKVLKHS